MKHVWSLSAHWGHIAKLIPCSPMSQETENIPARHIWVSHEQTSSTNAQVMDSQPHPCFPSALHHQQHRHTPTKASSAKYSLPPAALIHSGLWKTEWDQTPFQAETSCPGLSWRKITSIPAKTRTPVNSDYYFTLQLVFLFHNLYQQIAVMPFHPEKHL